MRKLTVVANWKMNGRLEANKQLIQELLNHDNDHVEVVLCVPFPFLDQVATLISESQIMLGAQNVSHFMAGAYTGEVSVAMLKDFGSEFVIVGHSERRENYGETNAIVGEKARIVIAENMKPIICIGESHEQREQGATEKFVRKQVGDVIDVIGSSKIGSCIFAYEPIWAIGTGKTADPVSVQIVHDVIRKQLSEFVGEKAEFVKIIYGGSLKADNSKALFSQVDVDGGLVGGASLSSNEFIKIIASAKTVDK